MNKQDAQNGTLPEGLLTGTIIGCAFDVLNELGSGFLESVYEKALLMALQQKGLHAEVQKPLKVCFRGQIVGDFFADLIVEDKVLIELKSIRELVPQNEAQIINYLQATGIELGLLLNFGNVRLEYKRFTRKKNPAHPVHPC
jgi:GxxExxY protein